MKRVVLAGGVLLAAGLCVGAALLFWPGGDREPASPTPPEATDPFADLLARPLRRPRLADGAPCPDPLEGAVGLPAGIPAEAALGTGPVHPVSRAIPRFLDFFPPDRAGPREAGVWRANETMWISEPRYEGPVLIRGQAVRGAARLRFGAGLDPELELRLPAGEWDEALRPLRVWGRAVRPPAGWRVTAALTRVLVREPDAANRCFFFQIDGTSFSETVLVGVLIQP